MTVSIPLPHPNPTSSYWQTPPHPLANHRTTATLPSTVTYAIIGSGITGAIIAYKLLLQDPNASIIMFEARQASSGATGRNGGHCRTGRYLNFEKDIENFGLEDAVRLMLLEENTVRNVGKTIQDLGIECDLRSVETLDIFTDEVQWADALRAVSRIEEELQRDDGDERLKKGGITQHKIWSQDETREQLLIPEGLGAISFPAFVLSPYKFVCGLLELAISKGLNLQTNTPVVEVSPTSVAFSYLSGEQLPHQRRWIVSTRDRGEVVADKVILATNAYTAGLYPPLAEFIIPTRGQVAAVRPGSRIAGNPVLKRSAGLNSKESGDYYQSRLKGVSGEGDLIIGGGRLMGSHGEQPTLDDSVIHPNISAYLTRRVPEKYFGRETWGEHGRVIQEWTGIMGYTVDRQPIVGEALETGHQGLYICAGFNGHGMGLVFEAADALVQILMGRQEEVDTWLPECYKLSRVFERTEARIDDSMITRLNAV
ncbi:FAD dependent oxidoreductase superfamily protein [Xylogone sp. PMI_703]|nr:FAD dependent oxidoreductase superfamily protein [Xylogone sp. PMI_703]